MYKLKYGELPNTDVETCTERNFSSFSHWILKIGANMNMESSKIITNMTLKLVGKKKCIKF